MQTLWPILWRDFYDKYTIICDEKIPDENIFSNGELRKCFFALNQALTSIHLAQDSLGYKPTQAVSVSPYAKTSDNNEEFRRKFWNSVAACNKQRTGISPSFIIEAITEKAAKEGIAIDSKFAQYFLNMPDCTNHR